jgi:hypothetical protein
MSKGSAFIVDSSTEDENRYVGMIQQKVDEKLGYFGAKLENLKETPWVLPSVGVFRSLANGHHMGKEHREALKCR